MKNRTMAPIVFAAVAGCLILPATSAAQDAKQAVQQKVAAFRQSVAANQKALSQYTWTENTQTLLKGEVKSTKMEACRYGPDGKVEKTLLSPPPEQKSMRGIKKKVVEKKTGEMKDYMERVELLIARYIPPQPALIQAAAASGNASLSPQPGNELQLQFKNFVKNGDAVTFTLDTAAHLIRQLTVDTYLDEAADKVTLAADFQTLPDGTNYAASKRLNVAAKQITINVSDGNYQRLAK